MNLNQIKNLISKSNVTTNKWELDNIVWWDRTTNPESLIRFVNRIQELTDQKTLTAEETKELQYLSELLDELEQDECDELLNRTDEQSKDAFIEDLARTSAIEILTGGKISYETMNTACKLSPSDFIMCAKRTQDLLNAIQGLVIKGETLSKDVAGA
jgi:Mg/Co/Ni transporter MgtE